MNVSSALKLKDFADQNKLPYIVTFDNEHHMYGNSGPLQIVWDDINEICIQISVNQDPNIRSNKYPMRVNISGYDQIQHVQIMLDKASQNKFIDEFMKADLTDEDYTKMKEAVCRITAGSTTPLPSNSKE